jgi:hypothetical protein
MTIGSRDALINLRVGRYTAVGRELEMQLVDKQLIYW